MKASTTMAGRNEREGAGDVVAKSAVASHGPRGRGREGERWRGGGESGRGGRESWLGAPPWRHGGIGEHSELLVKCS
jgi:hypothetical protein